jgi:hypothetical protein
LCSCEQSASSRRVEQPCLYEGAFYRIDFRLDVSDPCELNGERSGIQFDLTKRLCHLEEFIPLDARSFVSEPSDCRLNGDNALVQIGTLLRPLRVHAQLISSRLDASLVSAISSGNFDGSLKAGRAYGSSPAIWERSAALSTPLLTSLS